MNIRKRIISTVLMILMFFTAFYITPVRYTDAAASRYIWAEEFAEVLAKELGLQPVNGAESSGYVNALLEKGILKPGEIANYKSDIYRADAMLLLNRADEYLYGDTLDDDLVQLAIDKRISDIGIIKAGKRVDVAKAYLKGYLKGFSNGAYSTDRTFKFKKKLIRADALVCIEKLKNKDLRNQISPDGQLIRTTNLPYSYKKFPYILASYPNSYYDWKLKYELSDGHTYDGKFYEWINLVDYASPANIDKITSYNITETKNKYLDTWVDKVQSYMELIFSANYKTINDVWVESVLKTDYAYGQRIEDQTRDRIKQYVTDMKVNKTIVEYAKVNVDGSSLYYFNDQFYLRVYVKYRIVSSNVGKVDTDTRIKEKPYNDILWSRYPGVNFVDFAIGKWRECCFDISLNQYTSDMSKTGIFFAYLDEHFFSQYKITK